jgi:hypothetical protein
MRTCLVFLLLFTSHITACSRRGGAAGNPGNPAPVEGAAPGPGTYSPPRGSPGDEGVAGLPSGERVPVRADQAPMVRIRDVLEVDSLMGQRVRVSGRCTASGEGRRAGSWTLENAGARIEVRGLVPSHCGIRSEEALTIFAQIEPTAADSHERLLLRLPD